jgi:hypothetical protein
LILFFSEKAAIIMFNTSTQTNSAALKKAPTIAYHESDDTIKFFCVYLEFIIDWTKMDIENYHSAMMLAGPNEEHFLKTIAQKKMQMLSSFTVHRIAEYQDWFCSPLLTPQQQSAGCPGNVNSASRISTMKHAFNFAFQKEHQSLVIFKKANRPNLEATIKALLEIAIVEQQQILTTLESMQRMNGWESSHLYDYSERELTCPSFL